MSTRGSWIALAIAGLGWSCANGSGRLVETDASVLEPPAPPSTGRAATSPALSFVGTTAGTFAARNAAQRFETVVDARGAHVTSAGAPWSLGLHLARVGRKSAMREAPATAPAARADRVELARPDAREWFAHDARGLEQGVDLAERPEGDGELVLEVATDGLSPLLAPSGARVDLRDGAGRVALSYGELAVKDADGRAVPASFAVEGTTIAIRVRDEGARYPLAVDPLLWGQQFMWSSPFPGASFGASIAVGSDTAIIGSPSYGAGIGHASVYVRSGSAWPNQAYLHGTPAKYANTVDAFGVSIALVNDTAIIGASYQKGTAGGVQSGVAYVFGRSAGAWSQLQELEPPSAEQTSGVSYHPQSGWLDEGPPRGPTIRMKAPLGPCDRSEGPLGARG
jgi:hypothetical protein